MKIDSWKITLFALAVVTAAVLIFPGRLSIGKYLNQSFMYKEAFRELMKAYSSGDEEALAVMSNTWLGYGDPDSAIASLQVLVRAHPADPGLRKRLAKVYQWNKQPDKAARQLEIASMISPEDEKLHAQLVDYYLWVQDYRKAKRHLASLVSLAPDSISNYELLADVYSWEDSLEQGAQVLELALERHPGNVPLLLKTAQFRTWEGKPEEAIRIYERVAWIEPRDQEFKYELAQLYVATGRLREACRLLPGLVEKRPANRDIVELAAKAFLWNSMPEESAFFWEKLLELEPGNVEALKTLSQIYLGLGDDESAVRILRALIAAGEDPRKYGVELADLLMWTGKQAESREELERLVLSGHWDLDVVNMLQQVYSSEGSTQKLVKLLEDYLEHEGWRVETQPLKEKAETLAQLYVDSGREGDAADVYEKIVRYHPEDSFLLMRQATLLSGLGRLDEAIPYYGELVSRNPSDEALLSTLADHYAWTGRYERELDLRLRLLEKQPGNPDRVKALANAYDNTGRYTEAAELYALLAEVKGPPGELYAAAGDRMVWAGKPLKAAHYFKLALERDPGSAPVLKKLAFSLLGSYRREEALEYLSEYLEKNPEDAEAAVTMADLLRPEDAKKAALVLERAAGVVRTMDETKTKSLLSAKIEARKGEWHAWESTCARMIARYGLGRDTAPVYLEGLMMKRDLKRAEEVITRLLASEPDEFEWRYLRGQLRMKQGKPSLAEKEYEELLSRDPDNIGLKADLAYASRLSGDWRKAHSLYAELVRALGPVTELAKAKTEIAWAHLPLLTLQLRMQARPAGSSEKRQLLTLRAPWGKAFNVKLGYERISYAGNSSPAGELFNARYHDLSLSLEAEFWGRFHAEISGGLTRTGASTNRSGIVRLGYSGQGGWEIGMSVPYNRPWGELTEAAELGALSSGYRVRLSHPLAGAGILETRISNERVSLASSGEDEGYGRRRSYTVSLATRREIGRSTVTAVFETYGSAFQREESPLGNLLPALAQEKTISFTVAAERDVLRSGRAHVHGSLRRDRLRDQTTYELAADWVALLGRNTRLRTALSYQNGHLTSGDGRYVTGTVTVERIF